MNEAEEPQGSPYEAPAATLERPEDGHYLSPAALRSLTGSHRWMILAAVALMLNGASLLFIVLYTLVTWENVPGRMKFVLFMLAVQANFFFFPGLRLLQSALATGRARRSGGAEPDVLEALQRHEAFWKFLGIAFLATGIMTIVLLMLSSPGLTYE